MSDQLKKNEGLDRRSFLRGSSLFAAAVGLSLAARPLSALAQEAPPQQKRKEEEKKKEQEKKKKQDEKRRKEEEKKKKEEEKKKDEEYDPFKEEDNALRDVQRDKDGREVRTCPQCGANMYKTGRTWICENCGYSYVE